jgi:hypothetical protein
MVVFTLCFTQWVRCTSEDIPPPQQQEWGRTQPLPHPTKNVPTVLGPLPLHFERFESTLRQYK